MNNIYSTNEFTSTKNSNAALFDSSIKLPLMISDDEPEERTILNLHGYNIYQDKRKNTIFTITHSKNNESNAVIFNSIIEPKLINNSTVIKDNKENKSLLFKALSVESFYQFKKRHYIVNGTNRLPYNLILKMFYSLSKQICYLLKNESKCFYKLDVANIVVIDNCRFIYLSSEDLKEVKEDKIVIYRPISKNQGYLSPELKNAKSIPILVSYKTIYYSLGLLILENVVNNVEIITTTTIQEAFTDKISNALDDELNSIKETKLYYFLKKCLSGKPNNRFLLYL